MKPLLMILLLCAPLSAQTIVSDKFTGSDQYQTKRIEVYRNRGGLLVYNPASVEVRVVKPIGKPNLYLWIDVDSYDWQFTRSCYVYLLADGKRFQYPCAVTDSSAYSLGRDVYVTEALSASIPASEYKTIFGSKSVEMRIGGYEFKLKDKHLKELRTVIIEEISTP